MPTPPPPPGFILDASAKQSPPPPPPGFSLDQGAPPPPPPPGFKVDTAPAKPNAPRETFAERHPIVSGIAEWTGAAPLAREYQQQARQGYEALKGDVTAPVQGAPKKGVGNYIVKDVGSQGREAPSVADYAARAGTTALDALSYLNTPLHAATKTFLGRPAEALGGPRAETVANVADMVLPFANKGKALAQGAMGVGKEIGGAFEKLLSPTTVAPEAGKTERIIRRASGESQLHNEKVADRLVRHNAALSELPVPQQRALVADIEAGRTPADPKMAAAAKDIREAYDSWKNRVQKVLPASAQPNFIKDYYAHIWKDKPSVVQERLGTASRQGSGRSFKQRTIPTISDGIAAGLTPKFENPVEATMAYSQNMARYVATHDMLNEMKTQGYAKWYSPGSKNIPQGWVPLEGIMTSKTAPVTKSGVAAGGRPIQLYAPPAAARVFNNFISKGLDQGDVGPFYQAARAASNGLTQLKLGLSTFHLVTMANEAMISEMARGIGAISRGKVGEGLKAIAKSPAAPVLSAKRGLKMQREMLDKAMPDAVSKKVNDAFVRSGQTLRMDPFYRTRASGSFYNALEKGTFRRELKDAADKLYKGTPYENAKGAVDLAGNIIQSTAAPLFEKYIPMVKRGAFASRMENFIKENPAATQEQIDQAAVKIADSIDNRFGELNQDNLFWQRWMKQVAQIALLSPTWNLGTIREIGGGIKDAMGALPDVMKGKGITDRTAYVAALAAQVALMNGVATYFKTGEAPQGKDFMAYRTGGRSPSGTPERAATPGYQKDVYAFGYDFPHHILDEAANKLNPALSAAVGAIQNKDYRGLPIFRPEGAPSIPGEPTPMDFALDTLMPISVGQFSQGQKKGSNISLPERLMSIRPAPSYITDTQRQQTLQQRRGTQDWKRRIKADARAKAQQQ